MVEKQDLIKVSDVLEAAFYPNPLHRVMLKEQLKVPLEDHLDFELTRGTFKDRVVEMKDAGADVIQSDDFAVVAVWVKPKLQLPPPPTVTDTIKEFKTKIQALKATHGYTDRVDWHLNLIARDENKKTKGSVRKVIEPFLQKVKDDKVGASLVAIDKHAREVYEHFGFKVIGHITVGENRLDENGNPDPKGKGIEATYMVYDV